MITGNVIQITGLYFQLCPVRGVQHYYFQGTFFRGFSGRPYAGIMIDKNGLAKLSEISNHSEQGTGFLKEYIGDPPYHNEPILYRFHTQPHDRLYWIGRYELIGGKMWGETHATVTCLDDSLCHIEEWSNWYSVAQKEVLRKAERATKSLPYAFTHISLPPRIPYSTNDEALPPIEGYGSDIEDICDRMTSEQRPFLEAWATLYSRCTIVAQRRQMSVNELLESARGAIGRNLVNTDILALLLTEFALSDGLD